MWLEAEQPDDHAPGSACGIRESLELLIDDPTRAIIIRD
jgi:hypothetical protein